RVARYLERAAARHREGPESRARNLSSADHIGEDAIGARNAGGQLPEPGVSRKNVHSLAVAGVEHAAGVRLFARIVRFENRLVTRVEFGGEVQPPLLYPTFEIALGNL